MDLDLFYAGDCDINFSLGGFRGGIKDFQIHGTVRVVMKPLIPNPPLVGGLQIFFLNNPNIDFNLVGVIDLLDMPGLSDILRRIIIEQVAAMMVLPNKLPIILRSVTSRSGFFFFFIFSKTLQFSIKTVNIFYWKLQKLSKILY